jgi:lipoprotein-releasing system permease protein
LIIVMSVMSGFREELLSSILGFNGHLGVYGAGTSISDYDAAAVKIRTVPGVVAALPVVDGQVLLTNNRGGSTGAMIRGISHDDILKLHSVSDHIMAGSLDNFTGKNAIAIGATMAENYGLGVGSQVTLISPNEVATPFGSIPPMKSYRVVAIFDVGMSQYDSSYAFLPIKAAQAFFQMPAAASQIVVMATDPDHVAAVSQGIQNVLGDRQIRVLDWQQNENAFFTAVAVEKNTMFLILTLIILVAAFNVVSSLIMMVKDKTGDIAVLRTIGASRGAILRIFLMCGASVGVTGTLVGVMLGVLFCENIQRIQGWVEAITGTKVFNPEIYYLAHVPAKLNGGEVIEVVAIALILSLAATLYPSWRAAQTDPVEALRHE